MKTTSTIFPISIADYFSYNPVSPPFSRLAAEAAKTTSGALAGLGRVTKDEPTRLCVIPQKPEDVRIGTTPWSHALQSELCRRWPVLDGLSIPAASIISVSHWVASPHSLADQLDGWAETSPRPTPLSATAGALRQHDADASRWYKLVICPDHRVADSAAAQVRAKGFEVSAVLFNRFLLVTCEAWHPGALYPGFNVESVM